MVDRYDARANVYPPNARPEEKIDAAEGLDHGDRAVHAAGLRLRDARPGVRGVTGYTDQNAHSAARTAA